MSISIGILAGGKSSRMGQDKAQLTICGRTFAERIISEFSGYDDVMVSSNDADYPSVRVLRDENAGIGPIEGIRRVLTEAKNEYTFICGTDMPFIESHISEYLSGYISSDYDCWCIEADGHIHPLCAVYSKCVVTVIDAMIKRGDHRLMNLLANIRTKRIGLECTSFDERIVRNINTPEEYRRALLPIVFCVSGVKNSGKTTMTVRLIERFKNDGYSVGAIKHDGHDYVMDRPNTDTSRFLNAGALCSGIFSGAKYSLTCQRSISEKELIKMYGGADVIIIEGLKNSSYPKVEVIRAENPEGHICDEKTLICAASDMDANSSELGCVPVFDIDDINSVYGCIKKYFGI